MTNFKISKTDFLNKFYEAEVAYMKEDYSKAVSLLRPLVEAGYADAQYNLGVLYDNGRGVAQDYKEAVRLYKLASDQCNASAQFNLGAMYFNGEGVPKSYKTAAVFFSQVANLSLEAA